MYIVASCNLTGYPVFLAFRFFDYELLGVDSVDRSLGHSLAKSGPRAVDVTRVGRQWWDPACKPFCEERSLSWYRISHRPMILTTIQTFSHTTQARMRRDCIEFDSPLAGLRRDSISMRSKPPPVGLRRELMFMRSMMCLSIVSESQSSDNYLSCCM